MRNIWKSALDARKLLPLAFVLMLTFLVAMAWDSFARIRELLNSQAFVEHTHQVLHEMDGVEDGLQDAREAALHYVLTPEKQDIETFERGVAQIWVKIDRMVVLTHDEPDHQARLKQLRGWIEEEVQQMRDNLRTQHQVLIFHTPEADFRRNRTGEAISSFKDEEERLLRERTQAAQLRAEQIKQSVIVRIGVFSALMGVVFILVIWESRKLRIAEQSALLAQNRLEVSLQQLQSETENNRLLNDVQGKLQICNKPGEVYEIVAASMEALMPGSAGVVFAIDSSRNLMENMAHWGEGSHSQHQSFSPDDCCAVRGGRLFSHLESERGLSCGHFGDHVPEAYICLPLAALGEVLGILNASSSNPAVLTSRMALIQQVGGYAALRLANIKLKEKLQSQSVRDPLTGLYNRRFLETMLEQELRRSAQRHTGTGLIMADIDGFKQFNDRFGHEAGDSVLKEVAALLRRSVRGEDIVCRFGGEEFVAVIPDSSPEGVYERAELMRAAISKLELEYEGRSLGTITASFGIAFSRNGSLSQEVILRYADEALYDAKRRGCDCVSLSDSVSSLLAKSAQAGD
jgi:diguanylate cyclase (GGDEF)-like protein